MGGSSNATGYRNSRKPLIRFPMSVVDAANQRLRDGFLSYTVSTDCTFPCVGETRTLYECSDASYVAAQCISVGCQYCYPVHLGLAQLSYSA
jgi:hypothetical protein